MRSERELLDSLIKKKLGEGKAEFEVSVRRKQIDMVFEKENEIWLVEAKEKLNFEALGQVLTYEKLYREQFSPQKALKLGIVCEEGDSGIEQACQSQGMKVFILPEQEAKEEKIEGVPICGVCGSRMEEEGGEFKCKTCEYFFGMSSVIETCSKCGAKFGSYWRIEQDVLAGVSWGISVRCQKWYRREQLCPNCRRREVHNYDSGTTWGTISELLKKTLDQRITTPYQLEASTGLPKEFIDYCLGKMKPYLGDGKCQDIM